MVGFVLVCSVLVWFCCCVLFLFDLVWFGLLVCLFGFFVCFLWKAFSHLDVDFMSRDCYFKTSLPLCFPNEASAKSKSRAKTAAIWQPSISIQPPGSGRDLRVFSCTQMRTTFSCNDVTKVKRVNLNLLLAKNRSSKIDSELLVVTSPPFIL